MAVLLNGMNLPAVSPEFKYIARGLVLSLAVGSSLADNRVRLARRVTFRVAPHEPVRTGALYYL